MSLEHAALEFNNIRIITTISFAHFMMVIFVKLIKKSRYVNALRKTFVTLKNIFK